MIPPTKPPSTTLYGPAYHRNLSSGSKNDQDDLKSAKNSSKQDDSVMNKGWNFLADVLSVTSNLKQSGERARSRDSLPANHNNNNSLDIPTIKTR